jgi:flagellar biosynthesis protein FlhG
MASSSIKFSQKLKLFRQMARLSTRYMIVDLGAGCHPNTLDTFILADRMITVMIPEVTSVENTFVFIKNALFRKVKTALKGPEFKTLVRDSWKSREALGLRNIRNLIDHIRSSHAGAAEVLDRELAAFRVYLVVNMTRDHKDVGLGLAVKSILLKYLGLEAQFAGPVEYDDAIWKSLREGRPFMLNHLSSPCTKQIQDLTDNIVQGREVHLPGWQA